MYHSTLGLREIKQKKEEEGLEWGWGFRDWSAWFRDKDSGFRVWSLRFGIEGLGVRASGFKYRV